MPDASCSLLCSRTGRTIHWCSVAIGFGARMETKSGAIYAVQDEVYAGTPTAVRILDVLDLVDDCSADARPHHPRSIVLECHVSFPWKEIIQAFRAFVVGGSICEVVESIPGQAMERSFWYDGVLCLANRCRSPARRQFNCLMFGGVRLFQYGN